MICLLIGAGVPTTANYILVATIMAPVIVELGAQAELVIPLIAVHLFVFYFGIMADVTPPVGLASYAAAAISGEDPNATGWQATWYSFRTAVLPFVFIFNPQILFIGVPPWWEVMLVVRDRRRWPRCSSRRRRWPGSGPAAPSSRSRCCCSRPSSSSGPTG